MRRIRHRINCGSPTACTGPDGSVWEGDAPTSDGSRWHRVGGSVAQRPAVLPIRPAAWGDLLRSEVSGLEAYHFDLPRGTYSARLVVTETHPTLVSLARRYDLSCNGIVVAPDIRPAAIAGGFARAGEVLVRGLRATDAGLRLGFSPGANLAGLEIAEGCSEDQPSCSVKGWAEEPMPAPAPPAADSRRARILFVGHSGTFYWAIPETITRMVALHQPRWRLETDAFYAGGKGVRFFLESTEVRQRLSRGGYDAVVLQDSSWGPLEQPEDFAACMPALIDLVRASGAQPLLYAYSGPLRHPPEQRRIIQRTYSEMGRCHGVPVVPCAAALALAQEAHPACDFHDADGHHLGLHGGYLYACCWYRALCGDSATGHREFAALAGQAEVPEGLARQLAAIADQACLAEGLDRQPAILDRLPIRSDA